MKIALVRKIAALLTVGLLGSLLLGLVVSGETVTSLPQASPGAVSAREEVVYVRLLADGAVKEMYVVSMLDVIEPGLITDYGSYTDVKNLTSTAPVLHGTDTVTFEASTGLFYYQGTPVSQSLPWDISITYLLDGKQHAPAELAGKNGQLEIKIGSGPGSAGSAGADYYNNYLLQVSVTLDTAKYVGIEAKGGTVANAGRNKIITYTFMPGKASDVSLHATVANLSLAAIELVAVPLAMQFETPDMSAMTEDLSLLSTAISSLHNGTEQLKRGAYELKQGAANLSAGSGQFYSGLGSLDGSSHRLALGSSEIQQALSAMSVALAGSPENSSMGSLTQLPAGLSQLSAGLVDISDALAQLKEGFSRSYEALESAIITIPEWSVSQEEIGGLYQANPGSKELLDKLTDYYTASRTVKATYEAVKPGFAAVDYSLTPIIESVSTIANSLSSLSQQIDLVLQKSDDLGMLTQLAQGISELAVNYNSFHAGLAAYTSGVSELTASFSSLQGGIIGLTEGTATLHEGVGAINKGTGELSAGVKDLPQRVELEIDNLVGQYDKSSFAPSSFVSERNANTTAVQFVMRTEKIEKVAPPPAPIKEEAQLNFWTRLLNLFR